ncbi:MAG: hypothetical protein LH469_13475 [Frankiaceae bacterium]|nr:hypothetical protein [Frankiaceae bacterium]
MTGEDYREAGFGGDIGWGLRPALVLIDLVQAYFTPGSDLCLPSRSCLESAARVLAAARAARPPRLPPRGAYAAGGGAGGGV